MEVIPMCLGTIKIG